MSDRISDVRALMIDGTAEPISLRTYRGRWSLDEMNVYRDPDRGEPSGTWIYLTLDGRWLWVMEDGTSWQARASDIRKRLCGDQVPFDIPEDLERALALHEREEAES